MDIDAIIPYGRNARDNAKAVPIVAESIREFGLKGQIVLESRERPVIVAGHTRWAACKSLGWTEIPDERIDYCDDLTEEQVKAYRLADNRTAEVATWNKALLKSEVRQISAIDMSRFGFDFKGKVRPYGAERARTDDYYNLGIINAGDCDSEGMPRLFPCDEVPSKLLPFNYAKGAEDHCCWLHFFIDDYQFERLWADPERYLPLISGFEGALSPDFSCYMDMPLPMQRWNEYRRRALACYWQRNGIDVIPTLSWTDERSYGFSFDGLPKKATYAVSTVGVMRDGDARGVWASGMERAIEVLQPERLIVYGGDTGFDFGTVETIRFDSNTAFRR
ncbi:MAG: DUF4417 domain-containing protein [Atopobiaceae bacterium]|nr:DUF4417 domain-containing protein [Atopobiaceae bacterium]